MRESELIRDNLSTFSWLRNFLFSAFRLVMEAWVLRFFGESLRSKRFDPASGINTRLAFRALLGVVLLAVSGCGNSVPYNATPIITGLYPGAVVQGSAGFNLIVTGLQFITTSTVYWNGNALKTTYDTNTEQLTAAVPASLLTLAGNQTIAVVNPPPGGGTSSTLTFFVDPPANPVPVISSLSPASAAPGGPAFNLTIAGTGFVSTTTANWNGQALAIVSQTSTQIVAGVAAANIANAGTAQVTVSTPTPGGGTSNSETFQITTTPTSAFPILVSESAPGGAADGRSDFPRVDSAADFVAFFSQATNLIDSGAHGNVFVRGTCVGEAPSCVARTSAVDIAPDGSAPDGAAFAGLAISGNGRFVAFRSTARNLISREVSGSEHLFLRDTCLGSSAPADCSPRTVLAGVDATSAPIIRLDGGPALSGDGRFVVFAGASGASAATPNSALQVFWRDTCLGVAAAAACEPRTEAVSVDPENNPGDASSIHPGISADGRFVVFESSAGLIPGVSSSATQIFIRDMCAGSAGVAPGCTPSTALVSVGLRGEPGAARSISPSIGDDVRFISFSSLAANLAGGMRPGVLERLVRDTCLGQDSCIAATNLASAASGVSPAILLGPDESESVTVTPDGRYAAIESSSANLVPGKSSGKGDVYLLRNSPR
jgi:hypothetical protein